MREIISLHVGQAGIQTGLAAWELFSLEHGIERDGSVKADPQSNSNISTFFQESSAGTAVPRALFVDLESTVIDGIKDSDFGGLFNPESFVSGKEDAANNFARAHYGQGKIIIDETIDQLRKMIEQCSCLQGLITYHAVGGGTGSGLTSLINNEIADDLSRVSRWSFSTWPSPKLRTSVVEPYNAVLCTESLLNDIDVSIVLDNEAVYEICNTHLGKPSPNFADLNSMVCQTISSVTASLRFDGALNMDINEFQTNLVPYPRIHFMLSSYGPIVSSKRAGHQTFSVDSITASAFAKENMMVKCDPSLGKYMSCSLMYRGDVGPNDITSALMKYRSAGSGVDFVGWSPTGFKTGINSQPPITVPNSSICALPRSVSMISNNTAIRSVFDRITDSFDLMFSKRAFLHWFVGEGLEESELLEAREQLSSLDRDYKEIEEDNEEFTYLGRDYM